MKREKPWIAFIQTLDEKRQKHRQRVLASSAPALLWIGEVLNSFAPKLTNATPAARRNLRTAERLLGKIKSALAKATGERS